MLMEVEK